MCIRDRSRAGHAHPLTGSGGIVRLLRLFDAVAASQFGPVQGQIGRTNDGLAAGGAMQDHFGHAHAHRQAQLGVACHPHGCASQGFAHGLGQHLAALGGRGGRQDGQEFLSAEAPQQVLPAKACAQGVRHLSLIHI